MTTQGQEPGPEQEPDYAMGKLLRLAAQLGTYGVTTKIMTEGSPPSLVMENGEVVTVCDGFFIGTFGKAFTVKAAVKALLTPEANPEPVSSSEWGVKWGWLSLSLPYYSEGSGGAHDRFRWYGPGAAAEITGVSSAVLRRWAEAGFLSQIHSRGGRRYLRAELDLIEEMGRRQKVTMPNLKAWAQATLYGFLSADASGHITWNFHR